MCSYVCSLTSYQIQGSSYSDYHHKIERYIFCVGAFVLYFILQKYYVNKCSVFFGVL
jgi:hypothetical protein